MKILNLKILVLKLLHILNLLDVIKASDFAGSTSGMVKYVKDYQPKKVMLVISMFDEWQRSSR